MSESSQKMLNDILEFVNFKKEVTLSLSDLQFVGPELVDPTVTTLITPNRRNSRVHVYFDGNIQWPAFDFNAYYNRLHLGKLFAMAPTYFSDEGETTIHELLPKLSAACKFDFTEDDVENGEFDQDGRFVLTAKSTSYGVFGSVPLAMGADPSPPWFIDQMRYYLSVNNSVLVQDASGDLLTLEQGPDKPVYVATYDDGVMESIYHQFSDLSDLTFDGGLVYAIPPNGRTYTRLVDSYENFPQVLQYVGAGSNGLAYVADLNETFADAKNKQYRVSQAQAPDTINFVPIGYLYWLRFTHPDFPKPVSFILRKES